MTYDLRREHWIPWRRRSGYVEWGTPALLVDRLEDDPVVAIAAPRPDFDGALQEFMIGLLSLALQPEDEDEWLARWRTPPATEELQAALDALPPAFDLDGDGPRFFQDFSGEELATVKLGTIEQMLIDAPGEQTERLNKDLFVKVGRVERLGRPAAAMALLTLQTYAPTGGQGYRTSLRGGGPLTTIVDPRVDAAGAWRAHEQPLWRKLWANAVTRTQWQSSGVMDGPQDVFPWLAPTRVSDPKRGRATTPGDAHPLQAFFGLPRRLRLEFSGPGRCDLTGRDDEETVIAFRTCNYGVQYSGWQHPLTPYYYDKRNDAWLPVHGQPDGVGWRDWLGITMRTPEAGTRKPAAVVAHFNERGRRIGTPVVRLHAFGYDVDNMKARGWIDANLPAFVVTDPERQRLLADTAGRLTNGTGIAAAALISAVKDAYFDRPNDAPGDLSQVKAELWGATGSAFFDIMRRITAADADVDLANEECLAFSTMLKRHVESIFDRWCTEDGIASDAMRRLVTARYNLVATLRGYSKLGKKLFMELRIPTPSDVRVARDARPHSYKEAKT